MFVTVFMCAVIVQPETRTSDLADYLFVISVDRSGGLRLVGQSFDLFIVQRSVVNLFQVYFRIYDDQNIVFDDVIYYKYLNFYISNNVTTSFRNFIV